MPATLEMTGLTERFHSARRHLIESYSQSISPLSIGIVTPYNGQARRVTLASSLVEQIAMLRPRGCDQNFCRLLVVVP